MTVLPDQSIPKYTVHVGRVVIVFKKKKTLKKAHLYFTINTTTIQLASFDIW